jgi:hypothetical protein
VKAALAHLDVSNPSERVVDAIRASAADTEADRRDMEADEAMTRRAVDQLTDGGVDAYEAALAELRADTREWWRAVLDGDAAAPDDTEEPASDDAAGLRRFLEGRVRRWFDTRRKELDNRTLIRDQAFGETLDPSKLERLGRYEVHLDRKLERMLAILLRLKDLRRVEIPA